MTDVEISSFFEKGKMFATLLVAIGVVMEFSLEWFSRPVNHRLELARKKVLAELQERTAEANKIAEQEKLERIKLELRIAPRYLSGLQQIKLSEKLKALGSFNVDIVVLSGSYEPTQVGSTIDLALKLAGWKPNLILFSGSMKAQGIGVQNIKGADVSIVKVVDLLVAALNMDRDMCQRIEPFDKPPQLGSGFVSGEVPNEGAMAPIRINIGEKP